MPHAEGAGVALHYLSEGAGPAVLLVHGMASDAPAWAPALSQLASAGLRAVALDRRGYGDSGAPEPYAATTIQEQAEDVAALLRAIDAVPALLVGDGFGALVVLELLVRRPDLARAAVLADPPLHAFVPGATRSAGRGAHAAGGGAARRRPRGRGTRLARRRRGRGGGCSDAPRGRLRAGLLRRLRRAVELVAVAWGAALERRAGRGRDGAGDRAARGRGGRRDRPARPGRAARRRRRRGGRHPQPRRRRRRSRPGGVKQRRPGVAARPAGRSSITVMKRRERASLADRLVAPSRPAHANRHIAAAARSACRSFMTCMNDRHAGRVLRSMCHSTMRSARCSRRPLHPAQTTTPPRVTPSEVPFDHANEPAKRSAKRASPLRSAAPPPRPCRHGARGRTAAPRRSRPG